jgi:arsenite-transporting ATPase
MRLLLYLGKGGVGKTTVAAATAAHAARLGHRALVVSTDIAHSLGDVLDHELGHVPERVGTRLWAQEINVLEDLRDYWGQLHVYLAGLLRKRGVKSVVAEEMATVPGMEDVVALLHMWKNATDGQFDVMVVDAAPTGESIRLLAMPETFDWYANRLGGWNAGATGIAASLVRGVVPEADFFGLLTALQGDLMSLRQVLLDADQTSFRLVVNPERVVIREAQRAQTYLNLFGYPLDAVVCNRILPATGHIDEFRRELLASEAEQLRQIDQIFAPLPILRVMRRPREVTGLRALEELGGEIYASCDPLGVLHRGPTMEVSELPDHGMLLAIPMPNVEAGRVSLVKRGDEIIVEIGNVKREIVLPRALAGREAREAEVREGRLEIVFDPAPSGAARAGARR